MFFLSAMVHNPVYSIPLQQTYSTQVNLTVINHLSGLVDMTPLTKCDPNWILGFERNPLSEEYMKNLGKETFRASSCIYFNNNAHAHSFRVSFFLLSVELHNSISSY